MRLTIAVPVAALLLAAECSAFAAKGGAGKRAKKSAGGGGGGGFGAAKPPPPSNQPELKEIVLGPAKTVYINVPPNQLAPEQMNREDVKKFAAAPAGSAARAAGGRHLAQLPSAGASHCQLPELRCRSKMHRPWLRIGTGVSCDSAGQAVASGTERY